VGPQAGQCVQVHGQRGHQGLAFSGLHLGDLALVEHHAAHELHVEMPLPYSAPARLADGGKGLGQQIVELLLVLVSGLELVGLGPQFSIVESLNVGL
jgi:hypothetical protein